MEQSLVARILSKIAVAVLVLALLDLLYLNWWVIKYQKANSKDQNLEQTRTVEAIPSPTPEASPTSLPGGEPKTETKTVETKTVVEKETQTIVQTAQREIFIPIGSSSTTSRNYVDLSGLEVTIDTSKYSTIESVVFEASIWVEGGNGRAYAQLKNITDNNPLIESEITSTSNKGEVKTSGKIPIPAGAKKYGVRAKTDIENFAAHVENARLKITLK